MVRAVPLLQLLYQYPDLVVYLYVVEEAHRHLQ